MLHFDVYLFDEHGAFLQLVPIWAASQERAREKALYLERSQRATSHSLMAFEIRRRDVFPDARDL
jgi:hypothetical protein